MRRWLRRILLLGLILALIPVALALLFRFVDPPSTLALWTRLTGGEVRQTWVPLERISVNLQRAVVTSEDQTFCTHWGIDLAAIRTAIRRADVNEDDIRGTSTITMQTAKNVFLWHGRSWIRKALEAPLAPMLDVVWGKRRTLEVYLNVVELGPGIFGAEAAARAHFGVSAAALTPAQAALLATALPGPRFRNASRPSAVHQRLANRLGERVRRAPADISCLDE